jgi:hypothetical protein
LASEAFQAADAFSRQQDRAGSQHEPFSRESHSRMYWRGALTRMPFVAQLLVQHVSSPLLDVENLKRLLNLRGC